MLQFRLLAKRYLSTTESVWRQEDVILALREGCREGGGIGRLTERAMLDSDLWAVNLTFCIV